MNPEKFLMMPMQMYYDCPNKENKKIDIIKKDIKHEYIASEKHDGEASMIIKINNCVYIRSRSLSVKTKRYGDYTAKLPHIVDEFMTMPDNTVVMAELCVNDGTNHAKYGTMSTDVGTVLRSLPPLAIKKQREHGNLVAVIFDCLMYDGVEIMDQPYENRVQLITEKFDDASTSQGYIYHTDFVFDNFNDFFEEVINKNGEGLVCVKRDYPYSPDKRTAWKTLKWKKHTETFDLKVIGTEDFTKEYTGKQLNKWQFFADDNNNKLQTYNPPESYKPVTKGWFYGWKAAVICEYNGTTIKCSSGLSDDDRAQLSEQHMQEHIRNGELFAEVSGMQNASQGRLRHPIINRLRIM